MNTTFKSVSDVQEAASEDIYLRSLTLQNGRGYWIKKGNKSISWVARKL